MLIDYLRESSVFMKVILPFVYWVSLVFIYMHLFNILSTSISVTKICRSQRFSHHFAMPQKILWRSKWRLYDIFRRYKVVSENSGVTFYYSRNLAEAQVKNFFCSRKAIFHSQDIQVFVFLTIPCFSKSVTSWWVLVHETECIFEYMFWTATY